MKKREANIEVMRCAMMFCIVLLHCCQFSPASGSMFAKGLKGLMYCGVDAFVFISGWYGIRFGWQKVMRLVGYGLFASVVVFLCSPLAGKGWCFKFSLGWFGNAYLALLCLSPIVNAGLEALRQKGNKALVAGWLAYAVMMVADWLPLGKGIDLQVGGWDGLSFNVLLFVYVTGRVVSWQEWSSRVAAWQAWLAVTVLGLVNVAWGYAAGISHAGECTHLIFVGTRDNNSPLTIAFALSIFFAFKTIRFPTILESVCTYLAPSMFCVFLLHLGANMDVSVAICNKYAFGLCGNVIGEAVLVFAGCTLVDIVRRQSMKVLSVLWGQAPFGVVKNDCITAFFGG